MIVNDVIQQLFSLNIFEIGKQFGPVWNSVITTIILGIVSYCSQHTQSMSRMTMDEIVYYYNIYIRRRKKYGITLTGHKEISYSAYNNYSNVRCNFSDRFKALWNYVSTNITGLSEVTALMETSNYLTSETESRYNAKTDIFMVSQPNSFLIEPKLKIYAKSTMEIEDTGNEKKTLSLEKYTVEVYSYMCDIQSIVEFVNKLSDDYVKNIENRRRYKRFYYNLNKIAGEDDGLSDMWREVEFKSPRSFANVFFEDKALCEKQIDFFLNNKQWYDTNGIHYAIGFGLYGPPGTGKTSFIKCLANKTNRHIVNISLKVIKTRQQLDKVFFESKYSPDNYDNRIEFENKIIIFEDIDCIGNIVMNRKVKRKMKKVGVVTDDNTWSSSESTSNKEHDSDSEECNAIINNCSSVTGTSQKKDNSSVILIPDVPRGEDPITLDDFLNLLDGVRETPGRIMVLTSNHYDKLDPALVRPGRIDCTIHMKKVTLAILQEMALYYYSKKIKKDDIDTILPEFYSAAEVVNIYTTHRNSFSGFVNRLKENTHI